ncbi:helix-turn-helix domain-containing protein [uncultured Tistrella sp.]|uniref:helix-turn-helix domain-containing protein n=1 Tax=Tistrella mobilis TaxID=171437 RepID=UPI000C091262|nr:helix-turn-helix domain-containing protein [uncultured Tistrella sp.]MAM76639.1 Cro/Cl family transcriptional regulator [Tistrella sp.]|tara:strand:- start:2907 stop:3701 length:795 start_codon:yes stop_codon:yes gene_type:complete
MSIEREFVDAVRVGDGDAGQVVGKSLKRLRRAAGLTQLEMAKRLGVGQAAISKIEQRGDVQISSLQRYVEALGARLRIDAAFKSHSEFGVRIQTELGGVGADDDQYVLPIFGDRDDIHPIRRDIVISIKPNYSGKIFDGIKTIELRRRFPSSVISGATAYIYSTSPEMALVGTTKIENVERLELSTLWKKHGRSASIKKIDFDEYFSGLKEGFALKLSMPRRFARPLTLPELKERFGFKAPQSFLYPKPDLQKALRNEQTNISD